MNEFELKIKVKKDFSPYVYAAVKRMNEKFTTKIYFSELKNFAEYDEHTIKLRTIEEIYLLGIMVENERALGVMNDVLYKVQNLIDSSL